MSDATGFAVLFGVFACAGLFAIWNARLRSAAQRHLAALGFEPCPGEETALAAAWRELGPPGAVPREVRVSGCTRRAAGWGMVHHFEVTDETQRDASTRGTAHVPARWSAYLVDLRDPGSIHSAPVTLYLLSGGSDLMRRLLRGVIALDAPGAELELAPHAWRGAILAAFAAAPGKLDAILPPGPQERLARAAEHGFFCVKLAHGKAAFAVLGGRRDVAREWSYLSHWC